MLLTILSWSFSVSGHSPTNKTSDKYIAAVAIGLLILSGSSSVVFWTGRGRNSLHSNIIALATVAIIFGTIAHLFSANVGSIKYQDMCSQISSLSAARIKPSVPFLMSLIFLYTCTLMSRLLFSAFKGLSLYTTIYRLCNFHLYTVPALQCLLVVEQLKIGFSEINDRLRATTLRSDINTIFREHLELQNSVKTVNSYFAIYHLLVDSGRVVYVLAQMYTILVSISRQTEKINITEFESTIFQILFLAITSIQCHRCAQEANRTIHIAHRQLGPDVAEERIDDVIDFSLPTFYTPVQFSVAGVFTFDNSFITKVTGICLTYLIITLQLS